MTIRPISPTQEIRMRITTLNHADDPFGRAVGSRWNLAILRSIRETNRILNTYGLNVSITGRCNLDVAPSRHLLTADIRRQARRGHLDYSWCRRVRRRNGRSSFINSRREGFSLPHLLAREFFADMADVVPTRRQPIGVASREVLGILAINRVPNEMSSYWVPGIEDPNAAGHSLFQPVYSNVSQNREGIFIAPHAPPDTLAHEIVHVLTRAGHCSFDGSPEGTSERSAGPENLMHHDRSARRGYQLTQGQVDRISAYGTYYFR